MDMTLVVGLGLLGVSLTLVILEAFLPSGGIIGFLAFAAAVAGVVMLFRYDTTWGLSGALSMLVLLPCAFLFAINMLPATPWGRRLINAPSEEEVAQAAHREQQIRDAYTALIGMEAIVLTPLRPVGAVMLDGRRMEAVSDLEFIPAGQRVRVVEADPRIIKVRPIA